MTSRVRNVNGFKRTARGAAPLNSPVKTVWSTWRGPVTWLLDLSWLELLVSVCVSRGNMGSLALLAVVVLLMFVDISEETSVGCKSLILHPPPHPSVIRRPSSFRPSSLHLVHPSSPHFFIFVFSCDDDISDAFHSTWLSLWTFYTVRAWQLLHYFSCCMWKSRKKGFYPSSPRFIFSVLSKFNSTFSDEARRVYTLNELHTADRSIFHVWNRKVTGDNPASFWCGFFVYFYSPSSLFL